MARPGLDKHPKFRRLMHMLGERRSHVKGYLECIWETAYESGNPLIGDDIDVALAADYPGDPGEFAKCASECGGDRPGFIEFVDGAWHVHDLYQNAPEYVQRRMEREAERNAKGLTISQLRAEAGRKGGLAKGKQPSANGQQVEANESQLLALAKQTEANGATPAPISHHPHPSPAPIGEVSPITPQAKRRQRRIAVTAADIMQDLEIPVELGHDSASKQAIRDWLEHKDRIRNQYASAKSFAVELARWAKIGPARFACAVAYSIGKEWKGIYEEQTNGKPAVTVKPKKSAAERDQSQRKAIAFEVVRLGRLAKRTDDEINASLQAKGLEWP